MLWLFGVIMNEEKEGWDDSIVAIPILGPIYERIFRPETYYKVDTVMMFQQSVHNAVLEAVDQMTSTKGARALSELERKPALMHFAKAAGSCAIVGDHIAGAFGTAAHPPVLRLGDMGPWLGGLVRAG